MIAVEDLAVKNLLKNHHVAKSLSDSALGKLSRQLEYKSGWHDRSFVKVGRFFASSKLCANCGIKKEQLLLKERQWTCEHCHTTHDRDINAAINILNEGLKILSGCGTQSDVKLKRGEASDRQESENPDAKASPKD